MIVIGLCGGSGAGKTTASEAMRQMGAAIIDTDKVYRELCVAGTECIRELTSAFGEDILTDSGELCRPKLANIVFGNEQALVNLNSITHKYIREETVRRIDEYRMIGYMATVVDAPLLFESGFDSLCDTTIGVVTDTETRIERIVKRDFITRDKAEKRINSQLSDEILRRRCEYILENNGEPGELYRNACALYRHLIKE